MTSITLKAEYTAEALLELLALRGVEYFIGGGAGTDSPFIIEAFASAKAKGIKVPVPITAVHEINAVAMAHGYAMVSHKPVFVMLHTIVGLANGICGVINASRARVPLFLAAGRTATAEHSHPAARFHVVQWGQEAFDQAGMLREFVKWDYELKHVDQLEATIDRGFAIARTAPAGPVYLSLPVELGAEAAGKLQVASPAKLSAPAPALPQDAACQRALDLLLQAERPLVITAAMGRTPGAPAALLQFAEALALPVVEYFHTHANFPQDHPLHLGFEVDTFISEADVILVIEHDAPWTPVTAGPAEDATVIVLDEDPLYASYPYRGFPSDLGLCGDAAVTLQYLNGLLEERELDTMRIEARRERLGRQHESQRRQWKQVAELAASSVPMDTTWISRCVGEVFNAETDILITEFVLDSRQVCITRPGSYFDHSHAGGLGWSCGAALGAKLAEPEKTIICCMGDGTYTFGVPVATHHMSAMHGLPVLFVIFNNAAYERTRLGARRVSPAGRVGEIDDIPLCELEPVPAYEKVCEAAGGYGERVEDPADLPAALERASKVVREEGRQALLNVICGKSGH